MAKREYTVVEATVLPDGNTRYVVEWEREGYGTQRPTFVFNENISFKLAVQKMRLLIDAERALNERSGRNAEPVGEPVADVIGKQF